MHDSCQPTSIEQPTVPVQNQQPMTERQFRELRGKYFTVRHHRVQPCGHKADSLNEPRHRNCQSCWFMFFESHPQLVEVTDRAFIEHGTRFLDRMRGKAYTKWFGRFMATKLRLKQEMDERNVQQSEEPNGPEIQPPCSIE